MSERREVRVPDIGDFTDVDVVEVLVAEGDRVEAEGSLITLETDKASLDVPSPAAGKVVSVRVKAGDKVSEGDVIAELEVDAEAEAERAAGAEEQSSSGSREEPGPSRADANAAGSERAADETPRTSPAGGDGGDSPPLPDADLTCDLVVVGAGPGGYTAAFRAADLGLDVVLVERFPVLGGVCLNVGCIPSKALLHAAAILDETAEFGERGIEFGKPKIDLDRLRAWKDGVVERLTKGLAQLAAKRKVRVVQGTASFKGPHELEIEGEEGSRTVAFHKAILAVGSRPIMLPDMPEDDRLMTSNEAIRLDRIPKSMLIVGGGIIGLEMAQIYGSLGTQISIVELLPALMPGADRDLVRPLERRIGKRYARIMTGTKVTGVQALKKGLKVSFEGSNAPDNETYGAVLVAVGRRPNGDRVAAERAGVTVDERGFVGVDERQRTNVAHIFAIGDLTGQPMLAHKATHEGKVAAEVAAGQDSVFDARVIPSVAYTDPEVAWVGVTEEQAQERGIEYDKGSIPWAASGRALGLGRTDGVTKLLFDRASGRLIGAGIVGPAAGDLIAEAALAIEMGADAHDIGLTVHPHPTLSETIAFAAEAVEGTITDLYLPKRG